MNTNTTLPGRTAIGVASLALAFVFSAQNANADPVVVFSTFGPNGSYDEFGALAVDGLDTFHAVRFVPSASGVLDQVVLPVNGIANVEQRVQFDLYTGSAVALDSRIESWIVANAPGTKVLTLESVLRPALIAGVGYWLRFTEPDPADLFSAGWMLNDQRIYGTLVYRTEFGSGSEPLTTIPAFSVSALVAPAPIPEPASVLLVGTGAAALASRIRRGRPRSRLR